MQRSATLLTVAALMACYAVWPAVAAQTTSHKPSKPKSASHIAPMRHDQLTLYPHGRPAGRQPPYSFTRHRFDHPTAIHNTFMGARF
jgi:hypothetical protein